MVLKKDIPFQHVQVIQRNDNKKKKVLDLILDSFKVVMFCFALVLYVPTFD